MESPSALNPNPILNPNPQPPHSHFPFPSYSLSPSTHTRMSSTSSSSSSPTFHNDHNITTLPESTHPSLHLPLNINAAVQPVSQITNGSTTPSSDGKFTSPSSNLDLCLSLSSSKDGFGSGVNADNRVEKGDRNVAPEEESRALAVVPPSQDNKTMLASDNKKLPKNGPRSAWMVRVSEMDLEMNMRFYEEYRVLRMLYDGLRVSPQLLSGERAIKMRERRDLDAASLMKKKGLWLHRDKRIIGSIPGVSVGDIFFWFIELCVFGLHGQTQAGIDYVCASHSMNGEPIATSIVYSGGYEDDEDFGDVIIYSGQGGKDKFNKQCANQILQGGNLALNNSMRYGIELRVIRGIKIDNKSISKVYVYDGLYKIVESWSDVGKSGFAVFKFKLVREPGQPCLGSAIIKLAENLRSDPLAVRPAGYVHLDISLERENFPVRLYNDVDSCSDPLSFEYISKTVFPVHVFQQANQSGCSCVSICRKNCACAMKNGGEFPYDKKGVLLRWKSVIFECGNFCKCPPDCRNRVSQNGLKTPLEVFRLNEARWGVRSLELIRAGTFVCEYAGIVLTKEQASLFTFIGDELIHPNTFIYRQRIWGDLSMVFPNFVKPTCPSIPPIEYAIDVSKFRNVASYIRHSSCPNLMVQPVMHSHCNLYFPHLMIFSMENILPMKELTLDLGILGEPGAGAKAMLHISS